MSANARANSQAGARPLGRLKAFAAARIATAVVCAAVVFGVAPATALAQSSGAVTGTVTAAAPCLTIDVTSLNFGTMTYGTTRVAGPTTLTNCSGTSQSLFAKGSDAMNASTVIWTLSPANSTVPCPDSYSYTLGSLPGSTGFFLTKTDTALPNQAAGATSPFNHHLGMPCAGSAGAGQTLTTTVTFTASF